MFAPAPLTVTRPSGLGIEGLTLPEFAELMRSRS